MTEVERSLAILWINGTCRHLTKHKQVIQAKLKSLPADEGAAGGIEKRRRLGRVVAVVLVQRHAVGEPKPHQGLDDRVHPGRWHGDDRFRPSGLIVSYLLTIVPATAERLPATTSGV